MKQIKKKMYERKGYPLRCLVFLLFGLLSAAFVRAQTISGTVVDMNNEPLPGVTVKVKNTLIGTATDVDGSYSLKIPDGKATLVFSFIGFKTFETPVSGRTIINVKLEEDSQLLEEIVVVGYGTMRKKDLTGAVGTVDGEVLAKEQPKTLQDMLRTGVPGLSMGIATDAKGNAGSILIRGKNSFRESNTPLLVLDGVIYYGELTDINPNDVERIDVLKDASSSAVYGAKAANGVILVTTKKGRAGKPMIRFSANVGASFRNGLPETYKGKEYIAYRQAVMESQNASRPAGFYADPSNLANTDLAAWMALDGSTGDPVDAWFSRLGFAPLERENYKAGRVVDWEDLTYQTAFNQDYTVSISGKKDDLSYYTSLNYLKNEGNVRGSGYSAVRARFNLESKANSFLTYGINTQFTSRDEGYVGVGSAGYRTASPYGDIYDADGKLKAYVNDNNNQLNPLIDAHYIDRMNDINNLNASIYLRVDLPLGFSVQTTYSPRYQWTTYLNHRSTEHPLWVNSTETAYRKATKQFYWQWDNTVKWNKTFGKHAFDATFLINWEMLQNWTEEMTNSGFQPSDVLGAHGIAWGTNPVIASDDNVQTGDALMGRLHYVYDNRYLITATYRRDGYSAFGQNNPRAGFPSVALGWVFSEESFFPESLALDYGKLRFSWGKNGNRDIGMYEALMRLEPRKYNYIDVLSGKVIDVNSYYAFRMANKNLKWESTSSFNLGLDFGVFGSRLTGSLDVYKKKTNDLLVSRELPDIIGYGSVMSNIGEVQNVGVELMLNSSNIDTKNFSWNTSFAFAYNKNRINKLYGLMENILDSEGNVIGQKEADDIQNKRFIGHSIDEIWDYKVEGVWQESEREEAAKYGLSPGDFKLLDKDRNYKFDNTDKEFLGSKVPKYRLSMRNTFTFFENLNFSFNLYSYLGQYKAFDRALNNGALINTTNQIKNEYWTPGNPTNEYARLGSKTLVTYSVWRKANFVRLDNISVGYQFPKNLIAPMKLEALNLSLTLKNMGYLSCWPGEDPENSGANTPRSVYFGLNVTF